LYSHPGFLAIRPVQCSPRTCGGETQHGEDGT